MSDKLGIGQQQDEKSLDSTSALQKVLKLDKRLTNFDFEDSFRSIAFRVTYPQIVTEGPSNQTLLKSLWKHANNYYFKKIDDQEYERLNYIGSILHSPVEEWHRFIVEQEFYTLIHSIFSDKYYHRYVFSEREKIDYHNWIEFLFMGWKVAAATDLKTSRKRLNQLNTLKDDVKAIYQTNHVTQLYKLQQERDQLSKYLQAPNYENDDDQISEQIRRLSRDMQELNSESRPIFDRLKDRVQFEMQTHQIIFCENSQEYQEIDSEGDLEMEVMRRKMDKLGEFQIQTQYIEYIINLLQKKQIAESVSKLYRVQKQKGDVKFHLHFQQSMGIKPIIISQQQFNSINQLRQYSLLKYYNTASKTKYSFICQNYLGFKDIYQNRHRPCKYKNKDMVEQMKKGPPDSINSNYYKEFNRMEICHHCKLLHHEDNLITCDYHSSKFGLPIPPSPYYDSYIFQILKNQQSRVSAIRFLNSTQSRRNSYYYYNKESNDFNMEDEEYVCGRKYCKYCLKNYDDGKQKSSGLCPFCRGACYCTRCARNDMMIRLKSMYILMGGEINKLQRNNLFERYYQNSEEQMDLRKKDKTGKIPRKPLSVPTRMNEKMLNIRFQLQDLRLLCDLAKRREKHKQKLLSIHKEIFREKISVKDREYFNRLERVEQDEGQDESQQEKERETMKLNDKLSKKLKRMIN